MVYGILIHALDGVIHFSQFFSPEGNDTSRKDREQLIVKRVQEDFAFRAVGGARAHGTAQPAAGGTAPDPALQADAVCEGVLRVAAGPLFSSVKTVAWRAVEAGCACTLVCEPHENPLLAAHFLAMFPALLCEHLEVSQPLARPLTITESADDIVLLLRHFLPCGQLLFLHGQLARHLQQHVQRLRRGGGSADT